MNKGELIDAVACELKSTKADATKAVDAVFGAVAGGIKDQERVAIAGFGTFTKRQRAARTCINPATGQPMPVPASTTCGFKPATALKASL